MKTRDMSTRARPQRPPSAVEAMSFDSFKRFFTATCQFYGNNSTIDERRKRLIQSRRLRVDHFHRLIAEVEMSHRIMLWDRQIRFLDVPQSPSRQIAAYLMETFVVQSHIQDPESILEASSDLFVDMNGRTSKCPSLSLRLQNDLLPDPPPAWLKYQLNGKPYPNVVCEVSTTNEFPRHDDLIDAYLSSETSVLLYIGVRVWITSRKFWVVIKKRMRYGHSVAYQMPLAPCHASLMEPLKGVLHIPASKVYGRGIPVPEKACEGYFLDLDELRLEILRLINHLNLRGQSIGYGLGN
jgi:hypothetical protein